MAWDVNVADQGIASIAGLPCLRTLYGCVKAITDTALLALAQCRSLRKLDLMGCGVTIEGLARLQAALPLCQIIA